MRTARNTTAAIFRDGVEYTKNEVQKILKSAGRKRVRMYYNVFGWSVYYTTAPTFATPTGRAAGFPRTKYIYTN